MACINLHGDDFGRWAFMLLGRSAGERVLSPAERGAEAWGGEGRRAEVRVPSLSRKLGYL
jgi:hypothetical protein